MPRLKGPVINLDTPTSRCSLSTFRLRWGSVLFALASGMRGQRSPLPQMAVSVSRERWRKWTFQNQPIHMENLIRLC
jgi:hypothetical protein